MPAAGSLSHVAAPRVSAAACQCWLTALHLARNTCRWTLAWVQVNTRLLSSVEQPPAQSKFNRMQKMTLCLSPALAAAAADAQLAGQTTSHKTCSSNSSGCLPPPAAAVTAQPAQHSQASQRYCIWGQYGRQRLPDLNEQLHNERAAACWPPLPRILGLLLVQSGLLHKAT